MHVVQARYITALSKSYEDRVLQGKPASPALLEVQLVSQSRQTVITARCCRVYQPCIGCFWRQAVGVLRRRGCLFGFSERTRARRGREVCSLSRLRAAAEHFPFTPLLFPAPHILPPLFPCFRSSSHDRKHRNVAGQ